MRTYCTAFGSGGLARGTVMLQSLLRYDSEASVRALALDAACAGALRDIFGGAVEVAESAAPATDGANPSVSLRQAFLHHLMERLSAHSIVWIAADTWFFADPSPVWAEIGDASIGLAPIHPSETAADTTGFIYFRRDDTSLRCVADWSNRNRFDQWPRRYPGVHLIEHPGVRLGAWNLDAHHLAVEGEAVTVDGKLLILFHFSGLARDAEGRWHSSHPRPSRQFDVAATHIYGPYLEAIETERRVLLRVYGIDSTGPAQPHGEAAVRFDPSRSRSKGRSTSERRPTAAAAPPTKRRIALAPFQLCPTKANCRSGNLDLILEGWKPEQAIIGPETRVFAMGSCFARHFAQWLEDHGFNRRLGGGPAPGWIKTPLENVAAIAHQFRLVFGDRSKNPEALLSREMLEQSDVAIVTLGLSEVWYDRLTGEPVRPGISRDYERYRCKILSVAETRATLEEIDEFRRKHLPGLKIVYTLSPIRLRVTFRRVSALTANSASKAILRAALDEFLRAHTEELNRTYFYFPAYEIVHELLAEPFRPDFRHLYQHVPEQILAVFAANYTTLDFKAPPAAARGERADFRNLIRRLEGKVAELQGVCDERQAVIEELDRAARERLEIIERLAGTAR